MSSPSFRQSEAAFRLVTQGSATTEPPPPPPLTFTEENLTIFALSCVASPPKPPPLGYAHKHWSLLSFVVGEAAGCERVSNVLSGVRRQQVNMLAREYCDMTKPKIKFKPVILSHHMLAGLKEGQAKMSKSDPGGFISYREREEVICQCCSW